MPQASAVSLTLSDNGRGRSASPAGTRALAVDVRRLAKQFGDAGASVMEHSTPNLSMCSNGNSIGAPSPCAALRRHTPLGSRGAPQQQVAAIAESVNSTVHNMLQQLDVDRRKVAAIERKLDIVVDEKARDSEGREKLAEVHGSVTGLLEEVQAQARRLDGLEERLWTRTSGAEIVKQRGKELEQTVQALEQQSRLMAASNEEALRRQTTKLCRAERSVEEIARRCMLVEEELRARPSGSPPVEDLELTSRLEVLEQAQTQLSADLQSLQVSFRSPAVWTGTQAAAGVGSQSTADEALKAVERTAASLEKKLSAQMEELSFQMAALKVKVDGQLNRLNTLAERMESVHEPAVESMREELMQVRSQDRKDADVETSTLRAKLQEVCNTVEDVTSELRGLQRSQIDLSSMLSRQEESQIRRMAEERIASQELRLTDLAAEVSELHATFQLTGKNPCYEQVGATSNQDFVSLQSEVAGLRSRLDVLETRETAAPQDTTVKASNASWDTLQQLSRLTQRTASGEAAAGALQHQVQRLQEKVETIGNQDSDSARVAMQMSTKMDVLSHQVADMQSRILELEGAVDFAREKDNTSLFPVSEAPSVVLVASEQATPAKEHLRAELPPPLPRLGDTGQPGMRNLEDMLESMASHLEIVDELSERVSALEKHKQQKWDEPQAHHPHTNGSVV
mmetsp:Transcript_44090/g.104327  ORF Transcript_44090/g.104327 Transcript_44090/m.104327 type:complete len:683 (-) Transcript_44090:61-2109(-)